MDAFNPERQRRIDQLRREQNPTRYDRQPTALHIPMAPLPERPHFDQTPPTASDRGVTIIQM